MSEKGNGLFGVTCNRESDKIQDLFFQFLGSFLVDIFKFHVHAFVFKYTEF